VLDQGYLYGDRVWFYDTRSPIRRMGVTTHPFDGTVVISFWQGDVCTGTFRLPVREAARLISTLAYGMSEGMNDELINSGDAGRIGRWPGRQWRRFLHRLFGRRSARSNSHLRLLK
jgi:hypothetical protein